MTLHSLCMIDLNARYTYHYPTSIRFGVGVIDELPAHLKEQGYRKPLIVTDATVAELPFFQKIIEGLNAAGLSPEVFKEMHKNPIKQDVLNGGKAYHGAACDCIAGIGGGVAMDVARAIALHVHHPRDLFDYDDLIGGDQFVNEPIPYFVTAPTTSGTGSEVGRSAIISEDETKKKRILFHPRLLAKKVFADPALTLDLPPFITAATGMDALTHNMEAFLAKGFHPMADGIALQGIFLIGHYLEKATLEGTMEARSGMMMASLMGAVAFQKGLGIVHSLAHPLSSLLDTHHGLANAVNLPYGLAFNISVAENRFQRMAQSFSLSDQRPEALIEYLLKLNERLGLPTRLSGIGVTSNHLPILASLAFQDFCHPSNPRPVTEQDFLRIYTEAL